MKVGTKCRDDAGVHRKLQQCREMVASCCGEDGSKKYGKSLARLRHRELARNQEPSTFSTHTYINAVHYCHRSSRKNPKSRKENWAEDSSKEIR